MGQPVPLMLHSVQHSPPSVIRITLSGRQSSALSPAGSAVPTSGVSVVPPPQRD